MKLFMLLSFSKGLVCGGTAKGCHEPGYNNIEQGEGYSSLYGLTEPDKRTPSRVRFFLCSNCMPEVSTSQGAVQRMRLNVQ